MDCIHEKQCHETCTRCDDFYELEEDYELVKQMLKEKEADRLSLLQKNWELTLKVNELENQLNETFNKSVEKYKELKIKEEILNNRIATLRGALKHE